MHSLYIHIWLYVPIETVLCISTCEWVLRTRLAGRNQLKDYFAHSQTQIYIKLWVGGCVCVCVYVKPGLKDYFAPFYYKSIAHFFLSQGQVENKYFM